jgi:hypothetical protein
MGKMLKKYIPPGHKAHNSNVSQLESLKECTLIILAIITKNAIKKV